MKKLNFALIGRGKFGKNYERLLQEIPEVSLQAIVTASSGNLESVLQNPEINCVVIATPPKTHFDLAKVALKSGKHVLVEKPMVISVAEAEQLKKIVSESSRTFMVGFQYLFNDYIRYLKKEIEGGAFGEIKNIRSEHFQSPPREDVNAFWDAAPHPLAIFQFLFNPEKITRISGEQQRLESPALEDYAKATIQFDRGPLLSITASWPGETKVRKLTIQGERITAIVDETQIAEKLILISNSDGKITVPEINAAEPLKNEVWHFITCIQNQKTPLTNVNFGCLNAQWLEEISNKLQKN